MVFKNYNIKLVKKFKPTLRINVLISLLTSKTVKDLPLSSAFRASIADRGSRYASKSGLKLKIVRVCIFDFIVCTALAEV